MIRFLPALALVLLTPFSATAAPKLALDVHTADAGAFGVTSTLVYGPTEAILVDAQFRNSDADQLAARIRSVAPGRTLKAIVVTHAHPDHYFLALNYRMNELTAAVGLAQLERYPRYLKQFNAVRDIYDDAIAGCGTATCFGTSLP